MTTEEKLTIARAALAYYADPENWGKVEDTDELSDLWMPWENGYARADQALKNIGESEYKRSEQE